MKLFEWAIELEQGSVGFAMKQEQLRHAESETNKMFPIYRVEKELLNPAAEAAQPGEPEDGSRTT